jgi:hypothetical protein
VFFHEFLEDEYSGDVDRHTGIVAFAVTGGAGDNRIVVGDAGFLGGPGDESMSVINAMTGLPLPYVAVHAVGIPAVPCSTLNPFFSRIPVT